VGGVVGVTGGVFTRHYGGDVAWGQVGHGVSRDVNSPGLAVVIDGGQVVGAANGDGDGVTGLGSAAHGAVDGLGLLGLGVVDHVVTAEQVVGNADRGVG
ncbi:hypothetical protein MLE19_22950, partial [Halomonas neptunia]